MTTACTLVLASAGCVTSRKERAESPEAEPARPAETASPTPAPSRGERLLSDAKLLERQGDYEGALTPLAEAAAFAHDQDPPDLALILRALSKRASMLVALTRYADARAVVAEALLLLKAGGAEVDQRMVELQETLCDSYRYEEQLEPALASFELALAAAGRHPKERHAELITVLHRIVDTQVLLRRDQAAAATVERLRSVVESGASNDSVHEKLGLAAA